MAHPGQDSPHGCVLSAFRLAHPDPPAALALKAVGLDIDVVRAPDAAMQATRATARGTVELR